MKRQGKGGGEEGSNAQKRFASGGDVSSDWKNHDPCATWAHEMSPRSRVSLEISEFTSRIRQQATPFASSSGGAVVWEPRCLRDSQGVDGASRFAGWRWREKEREGVSERAREEAVTVRWARDGRGEAGGGVLVSKSGHLVELSRKPTAEQWGMVMRKRGQMC